MRLPSVRSMVLGRSLAVVLVLGTHAALAFAQPSLMKVRGRIVADDNDRPLRRALVTPSGGDRRARPVLTDDEGRFEIQLPDLSAPLTVTKAGYASTRFTPAGRSSSQDATLMVRLSRGGVIAGRMVDSNGDAALGMKVVVRSEGDADALTFEAETDDLGDYRIAGIPSGRYTVSATVTGPRLLTAAENARLTTLVKQGRRIQDVLAESNSPPQVVDVRAGEETGPIDFEVDVGHTIRAVAEARHLLPPLPSVQPGQQGVITGPPQPELRGARIMINFDGSPLRSLDITLDGGGAVSGSVVDVAGEPFQGVTVRALRVRQENGRMMARAFGWERVTDDRGRYRLFGLAPGSYLIVASLDAVEFNAGRTAATGFPPIYFPGTTDAAAAEPLRIESGSGLNGTDLTFAASTAVRLVGKVVDSAGEPQVGRVLLGITERSGAIAPEPRSVRTKPDGSFELLDVAPGDYVLQAFGEARFGAPPGFGSEFITVGDRDPAPLTIATSSGATLTGRFVVEGDSDPPMRAYSLHATPIDPDRSPPNGRGPEGLAIYDDGRFYLTGLFGPMRLTAPTPLPGSYLKSVTIGGVDATDAPFDFGRAEATFADALIVLSNAGATIGGAILRQPGAPPVASTVIAFPTSRDNWYEGSRHIRRASSGADGSYKVAGLPPGEYFVAAIDAASALDLQAPDTLESLVPRAARVTAREGQTHTVTLRLVR